MKHLNLFALCCLSLLLSACSHIYSPAFYHQDIAYQPKPASFDSVKSATYISGGINLSTNSNLNDDQTAGEIDISEGHSFKNFNLAYGAFGAYGDYQNSAISKGDANYFTEKYYGVIGGRASANFTFPQGNADIRLIGFEVAYSHEFGDYAAYRRYLNNQPNFYVDPRTDLFTAGLTSEVIFHKRNDPNFQQGIRLFVGGTFGRNPLDDSYYNTNKSNDNPFDENNLFRNIFPKIGRAHV